MSKSHPMRLLRCLAVLPVMSAVVIFLSQPGICEQAPQDDPDTNRFFEDKTISFLNELSARRRVTTFFPNFQAPQYGVQEKFVNTSRGNLTFLVRDLVVIDAMPVVLGRVYDSTIREDADFGPGWKLSVREEILIEEDRLTFIDASNSRY